MSQALRPDFLNSIPSLVEQEKIKNKETSIEEQQLYAMSELAGWKVWKEYVERVMEEMVIANEEAAESGLSTEDVGLNTMVIAKTKKFIRRIFNKVEDAREACQKPDGTDRGN